MFKIEDIPKDLYACFFILFYAVLFHFFSSLYLSLYQLEPGAFGISW